MKMTELSSVFLTFMREITGPIKVKKKDVQLFCLLLKTKVENRIGSSSLFEHYDVRLVGFYYTLTLVRLSYSTFVTKKVTDPLKRRPQPLFTTYSIY